jgi:hypothetical protein
MIMRLLPCRKIWYSYRTKPIPCSSPCNTWIIYILIFLLYCARCIWFFFYLKIVLSQRARLGRGYNEFICQFNLDKCGYSAHMPKFYSCVQEWGSRTHLCLVQEWEYSRARWHHDCSYVPNDTYTEAYLRSKHICLEPSTATPISERSSFPFPISVLILQVGWSIRTLIHHVRTAYRSSAGTGIRRNMTGRLVDAETSKPPSCSAPSTQGHRILVPFPCRPARRRELRRSGDECTHV